MAGHVSSRMSSTHAPSRRGTEESPVVKWTLITIALAFVVIFLMLPLLNVFTQAFAMGYHYYFGALKDPDTLSAIRLTLLVAAFSVPLNLVFGVAAAWAIAKFEFRGKSLLITLIDLPFAVSPVVAGLVFVLLFGTQTALGSWLDQHDMQVIFAAPGIIIATTFITFPFVARELIPLMEATGSDPEQAAMTLGANGWQTFWYVTLPSVKWALLYGVILCNARAMGEFGAVSVVSGHIVGQTETMPLRVQTLNNDLNNGAVGAFSVASLLALLALLTLGLKSWIEWRTQRAYDRAQQAIHDL